MDTGAVCLVVVVYMLERLWNQCFEWHYGIL